MRQYLKNEVFKVSKWVELFISAIIMIAVIGGTIYLVKDVVQLMMNYPTSRDIYKFVGVAFNLVICIEFVKMLCKHTPDTLVEVMMFAIARQMIVEHTSHSRILQQFQRSRFYLRSRNSFLESLMIQIRQYFCQLREFQVSMNWFMWKFQKKHSIRHWENYLRNKLEQRVGIFRQDSVISLKEEHFVLPR